MNIQIEKSTNKTYVHILHGMKSLWPRRDLASQTKNLYLDFQQ